MYSVTTANKFALFAENSSDDEGQEVVKQSPAAPQKQEKSAAPPAKERENNRGGRSPQFRQGEGRDGGERGRGRGGGDRGRGRGGGDRGGRGGGGDRAFRNNERWENAEGGNTGDWADDGYRTAGGEAKGDRGSPRGRGGYRGGRGGFGGRGREFDRRSGTGRGTEMKRRGGGPRNWGAETDNWLPESPTEEKTETAGAAGDASGWDNGAPKGEESPNTGEAADKEREETVEKAPVPRDPQTIDLDKWKRQQEALRANLPTLPSGGAGRTKPVEDFEGCTKHTKEYDDKVERLESEERRPRAMKGTVSVYEFQSEYKPLRERGGGRGRGREEKEKDKEREAAKKAAAAAEIPYTPAPNIEDEMSFPKL